MLLLSQEGGVIPDLARDYKRRWRVSWNAEGMSSKTWSGTPSGLTALWFGVRLRTSCIIGVVISPEIIGAEKVKVGRTRPSQGNGAPGGIAGSGERAAISICASLVTTSARLVVRRADILFLRMERSVERMRSLFHLQLFRGWMLVDVRC